MHIENLKVGDSITVLRGHGQHCPEGCCVIGEAYADCKGLPHAILAINLPYVAAKRISGAGGKVFDLRQCELTKCSDDYVNAFLTMAGLPIVESGIAPPPDMPPGDEACAGK